jgi:hypothetical protein
MISGDRKPELPQQWEDLYKDALFEADLGKMQRRIELAKHAILDRLEDVNCAKNKESFQSGELLAAHGPSHAESARAALLHGTRGQDDRVRFGQWWQVSFASGSSRPARPP